jgi:hypothetical protein
MSYDRCVADGVEPEDFVGLGGASCPEVHPVSITGNKTTVLARTRRINTTTPCWLDPSSNERRPGGQRVVRPPTQAERTALYCG